MLCLVESFPSSPSELEIIIIPCCQLATAASARLGQKVEATGASKTSKAQAAAIFLIKVMPMVIRRLPEKRVNCEKIHFVIFISIINLKKPGRVNPSGV
jgi:hypothetical protein